jgi:hypothetical protein
MRSGLACYTWQMRVPAGKMIIIDAVQSMATTIIGAVTVAEIGTWLVERTAIRALVELIYLPFNLANGAFQLLR